MERLQGQTDIFEAFFRYAELGIAVLDSAGRIRRANEALGRYLGWAPAELEDRDLFECVPAKERQVARGTLDALKSRPSVRADQRFIRSDGRSVCALMTLSVVEQSGPDSMIVAIFDDITAERDAFREEREREQAARAAYAEVVAVMTGGRLLILAPSDLPDQLGERVLGPLVFTDEAGPGEVRHAMRDHVVERLPHLAWDDGFEVALGEALLNALNHGGGGEASLHVCNNLLQAVVADRGHGVDLRAVSPTCLEEGFAPMTILGVGFTLILSFTSRILLATGRQGTTIVLEGHNGGPDRTHPD